MKEKEEKPRDIRKRSFDYALRAINLYHSLHKAKDGAGLILAKQYLRSATSIGANIEEAQSAESKADFVHKYNIALKEAKESAYWLRLMAQSETVPGNRLTLLIGETEELVAIIASIILNAKKRCR